MFGGPEEKPADLKVCLVGVSPEVLNAGAVSSE